MLPCKLQLAPRPCLCVLAIALSPWRTAPRHEGEEKGERKVDVFATCFPSSDLSVGNALYVLHLPQYCNGCITVTYAIERQGRKVEVIAIGEWGRPNHRGRNKGGKCCGQGQGGDRAGEKCRGTYPGVGNGAGMCVAASPPASWNSSRSPLPLLCTSMAPPSLPPSLPPHAVQRPLCGVLQENASAHSGAASAKGLAHRGPTSAKCLRAQGPYCAPMPRRQGDYFGQMSLRTGGLPQPSASRTTELTTAACLACRGYWPTRRKGLLGQAHAGVATPRIWG